jgi:hypothetical protein
MLAARTLMCEDPGISDVILRLKSLAAPSLRLSFVRGRPSAMCGSCSYPAPDTMTEPS